MSTLDVLYMPLDFQIMFWYLLQCVKANSLCNPAENHPLIELMSVYVKSI